MYRERRSIVSHPSSMAITRYGTAARWEEREEDEPERPNDVSPYEPTPEKTVLNMHSRCPYNRVERRRRSMGKSLRSILPSNLGRSGV
jgi:hypothetical protein